MKDPYGRTIDYMRISVTDRCNLRCVYCMPRGIDCVSMSDILTYEEIAEVCRQAAVLGISRIKLTGGEPLARKGVPELVSMIKSIDGIDQVTLTTNGVLLKHELPKLLDAGVDGINISLDTLEPQQYRDITGQDCLAQVLESIEAVLDTSIPLKINAVAQEAIGPNMWIALTELARGRKLDIRFIELMPIGVGKQCRSVPLPLVKQVLEAHYGKLEQDDMIHGNGPAEYYKIPGFQGSIGFIGAVHGSFCGTCNRVRLTAEGQLKPCLCYGDSVDLRAVLREEDYDAEKLREKIFSAVMEKPEHHCFQELEQVSETKKMNQIGG